jgi:hypothetical protein
MTPIVLALLAASAPPAEAHGDAATAHHERFLFAGKIVAGTSRAAESTTALFGPGLDFEVVVWPEAGVEVEVAAAALLGDGLTSLPVELLLKKSFHVDRKTDLFVAAGGVSNFVIRDGHESETLLTGIVVAGAYLWNSEQFGLLIEMSYAPYAVDEGIEHDIEGAVGVAHRF